MASKAQLSQPANCFRLRCPLGDRYQRHKSWGMQPRAIICKSLQLRYAVVLIKIAHVSDTFNVACSLLTLKNRKWVIFT